MINTGLRRQLRTKERMTLVALIFEIFSYVSTRTEIILIIALRY